jgi:hypothetical protein
MVRLLEGYISCVDCSSIWGGGFSLRHMQRCRHAGKGTAAPACDLCESPAAGGMAMAYGAPPAGLPCIS